MRKERQMAGIAKAKEGGKRWGGRKVGTREEKEALIRQLHQQGTAVVAIARMVGLTRKTVYTALERQEQPSS